MTPTQIASIRKNAAEEIRVNLDAFKGYNLLQLRIWKQKPDGAVIPTQSGLAVRVELIPELRDALAKAEEEARRQKLLKASA